MRGWLLAVLIGCGGADRCDVCDLCAGATAERYFASINAVICSCSRSGAGLVIMGFDVPRSGPLELSAMDCDAVAATWAKSLNAAGGTCQSLSDSADGLYGEPFCPAVAGSY